MIAGICELLVEAENLSRAVLVGDRHYDAIGKADILIEPGVTGEVRFDNKLFNLAV